MKKAALLSLCSLAISLSAAEFDVPHQDFCYFGRLPEFTPGAGDAQEFRMPMAIDMGGRLPDLLIQADSRLWFYINESRRGKVLFSEPIVLMSTENRVVETAGAAVVQGNQLIIRRPDGALQFAAVVGQDVPVLQLGADVRDTNGNPLVLKDARFLLVPGVDGTIELVTESATRRAVMVEGELRFEAPVSDGAEGVLLWLRCFYSPADGYWKAANLLPEPESVMENAAVADFDGDGTPDMVLAGDGETHPISAIGIKSDSD